MQRHLKSVEHDVGGVAGGDVNDLASHNLSGVAVHDHDLRPHSGGKVAVSEGDHAARVAAINGWGRKFKASPSNGGSALR